MHTDRTILWTWLAALAALALAAQSVRGTRASLADLPTFAWRGAPLRSAALAEPEEEAIESLAQPLLDDGAFVLDLARLAFDDYDAPELRGDTTPLTAEAYPEAIRGLDGTEVIVAGFPQPIVFDEGRLVRLRLTRFPPGCCFGALPQYDEWLSVDLGPRGATSYEANAILHLRGRLVVGEAFDEAGVLESLYRLEDARVE